MYDIVHDGTGNGAYSLCVGRAPVRVELAAAPQAPRRGLGLHVLRSALGTATVGITGRCDRLVLVGVLDQTLEGDQARVVPLPRSYQRHPEADGCPAVVLVKRFVGPAEHNRVMFYLRPADWWDRVEMMGGNYAACSDCRLEHLTGFHGAVAVHDCFLG